MPIDPEIAKVIDATLKARAAIIEETEGKRRVQGAMDCPVCGKGTLSYVVAGNGHIHGQCSTAECVSWME